MSGINFTGNYTTLQCMQSHRSTPFTVQSAPSIRGTWQLSLPMSGGTVSAGDGKRDVNTFFDGSYEGSRISLFGGTAQDSLFHFSGTVEGDTIKLTLNVADQRKDLEAFRAE